MISNNNFKVGIIVDNEIIHPIIRQGYKYIPLHHNTQYKIKLTNNNDIRADSVIKIDGHKVGIWRLNPYSTIIIERPINTHKLFTFYKENTHSSSLAEIINGSPNNGLIEIKYIPEKRQHNTEIIEYDDIRENPYLSSNYSSNFKNMPTMSNIYQLHSNMTSNGLSSGGTGLSGYSKQRFTSTSPINEIDTENFTIISFRLVCDNTHKYTTFSNIPPRIESVVYPSPNFYRDNEYSSISPIHRFNPFTIYN